DLSQLLADLKPRTSKAKSSHGILVKGEDGILVKMAKCCNPIPGDAVIGYITRGRGISVHRTDCPNVLTNNEEDNRIIDVAWDIDTDAVYHVSLQVSSTDSPGVMADIMMVMSEAKVNINAINARTDKHKTAIINLGVDIRNAEQLTLISGKIRGLKGVFSVERNVATSIGG
ncbi:MAG: ACT domain-containing protein, partial [Acidaminococcaceae bacterium]